MTIRMNIDLRDVSRQDAQEARILLDHKPWLTFRGLVLRERTLGARAAAGVTDFEHDSAWLFSMPVARFWLEFVDQDMTIILAVVGRPGILGDVVRVPQVHGYDPTRLPGAHRCTTCEDGHWIIPEDHYSGPPTPSELTREVSGCTLEIQIAPRGFGAIR